jgi:prepilin-type processing-associated H-X9-DG protein
MDTNNFPAEAARRSYLINGWNDYFQTQLDDADWTLYTHGTYQGSMKEAFVKFPTDTIAFGEKETQSGHFYMDFYEGNGNDIEEVEQCRHSNPVKGTKGGGSNYAMVDGSARFIKWGRALTPINLWAVTPEGRAAYGTE